MTDKPEVYGQPEDTDAEPSAEPEGDPELVNKVVPIVVALCIVAIIGIVYFLLRRRNCCAHQDIEKGDSPGDIGYYHNKGYSADGNPKQIENGKNGISWVNERNGVETIPYTLPGADTNYNNQAESNNTEQASAPQASSSSKIPAGYVEVTPEDREKNQPYME